MELGKEATRCPILAACTTFEATCDHLNQHCIQCIRARTEEFANGREWLFTDGPPSWIAEKEEAERAVALEKAKIEKTEKKRGRPRKDGDRADASKPRPGQDVMAFLKDQAKGQGDKNLEYQITKHLKLSKDEAVKMRIQLKKEVAQERKEASKLLEKQEEEKERKKEAEEQGVSSKEMKKQAEVAKARERPWQPEVKKNLAVFHNERSNLSADEQRRFVAILSNYLQADATTRFDGNKADFKFFDDRLGPERLVMDELARKNLSGRLKQVVPSDAKYAMERFAARGTDARKFIVLSVIPWEKHTELPEVTTPCKPFLERRLIIGSTPSIQFPDMKNAVRTTMDYERFDPRKANKEPIEDDETAVSLCLTNALPLCMDATTAVHLLGRAVEPHSYSYYVPVKVVEQLKEGRFERVCVLSKPRPYGNVSVPAMTALMGKYIVKSTFTKPAPEKKKQPPKPVEVAPSTCAMPPSTDDPLSSILGMMQSSSGSGEEYSPDVTGAYSRSYNVFSFEKDGEKIPFLVRCSPNGRNDTAQFSIQTKIEYVPEGGAMKISADEKVWQYSKATFKGAQQFALFHMHHMDDHCLQVAFSRAIPHRVKDTDEAIRLLHLRSELLMELLREVVQLPVGEYAIRVDSDAQTLTILKQDDDGDTSLQWLKPKYDPKQTVRHESLYYGLDDRKVLQWQIMQSRVPGGLWPADHHILTTRGLNKPQKQHEQRGVKRAGGGGGEVEPLSASQKRKRQRQRAAEKRRMENEAQQSSAESSHE